MEVRPASPPPSNGAAAPDAQEIARLVRRQKAYWPAVRRTTARERIAKLKRLRAAILDHRQALRDALYEDFRKPPEEVDLTELLTVNTEIRHAVRHLRRWMKPRRAGTPLTLVGTRSEVRYEPKGVALIIAPWNYPVDLTLGPLVGAVAAGCTAVVKPSEHTPATSRAVEHLLAEVFDAREVAVVQGDHRAAQALLEQPFDHIYFTGSPAVGKIVMRAAAEHLASVTLELGGKSPVLIDATADVEDAAHKITFGKFTNAGQTCIAPDYVLVHERVHDAFVEALGRHIRAAYGPDAPARAASAGYARIVNDRHHGRLRGLYEDALAHGAQAATGAAAGPGCYLDPTVLTDVPAQAEVMEEEIFGPVLPVLPFATLDDAIAAVNRRPNPLALYIFSQDDDAVEHILQETTAGGTCVNDTLLHFLHPGLPFGGAGTSGIGKGHGHHAFLAFSNERPVLRQRLKRSPLKLFYPPYTDRTRRLIDLLLKYR
ncbi:MAG: aldehyde dehydrogenase family protein [Rhodothermales bacterium]|nr:aldehyde dehydrogenase family protein [Rhodothermales bacterium]